MMSNMHSPSILMFFLIVILCRLNCEARDSINTASPLSNNSETLVSAGNRFELGFFTPAGNEKGNRYVGIWYYKVMPRTVVWVANRDSPLSDSCGVLRVAEHGNLGVVCSNGSFVAIINLERSRALNGTWQLLDSGNLILVDGQSSQILWRSFHHPTDTFLPGMKMDEDLELTSWIGPSDPGKGNYTFGQGQGAYVVQNRSTVYWKSDEPVAFRADDGVPFLVKQILSDFDPGSDQKSDQPIVHNTRKRGAFYFNDSRIVMNYTGEIQYYNYSLVDGEGWSLTWSQPGDRCSVYNACGKFALCNLQNEPICQCLPGFRPASSGEGCDRESTAFSKEDKFLNISLVKVGGSVQKYDQAQDEGACRDECLNNFKCEAYLFHRDSSRETSSATKCWIWATDLANLQQDYNHGGLDLSLRMPFSATDSTTRICDPCVSNLIPYPLSTGPNCGDPSYYSFSCNNATGEVSFLAPSGKYQVAGMRKEKRRFFILVDLESDGTCNARNLSGQVLKLNLSLPFTVTNSCYAAYNDPRASSPQPEVRVGHLMEIGWRPPLEPTCDFSTDCKDWPNSECHDKGNGPKRCYCNQSYRWDDSSANCTEALGHLGKGSEASKNELETRYVIAFCVSVAGVMLVSCSGYIFYRRRRMTERGGNREITEASPVLFTYESERQIHDLMQENGRGIDVPFYNFDTVLSATDNFSDANQLGRGGFGPVYKGKFPGGREIAVKRLSAFSGQGIEEFLNEVVLIAKLQHRNLVRLLGYCIKENEKILLYEYMPNRSLDAFIFDQHKCLLLDWKKRFDIILGIARGLLYLHQDSRLRIIHRDLKTSNILLDEDMNPKISDFGLARIVEGKGTEASTNKVVGTYGYMSPEYALDGKFSIKSDVFSFGVVMLEIISGKKNTGFYNPHEVLNLLGYAWRLWCDNKALDLVDPTLLESCEKSQVMKCINIGLLCVQEDPNDRPTMSTVVIMLGSETNPLPLPTQPAFVVRRRLSSTSSSSSAKPDTISHNELTISLAQGR